MRMVWFLLLVIDHCIVGSVYHYKYCGDECEFQPDISHYATEVLPNSLNHNWVCSWCDHAILIIQWTGNIRMIYDWSALIMYGVAGAMQGSNSLTIWYEFNMVLPLAIIQPIPTDHPTKIIVPPIEPNAQPTHHQTLFDHNTTNQHWGDPMQCPKPFNMFRILSRNVNTMSNKQTTYLGKQQPMQSTSVKLMLSYFKKPT